MWPKVDRRVGLFLVFALLFDEMTAKIDVLCVFDYLEGYYTIAFRII